MLHFLEDFLPILIVDPQGVLIIIATILLIIGYWFLLNKARLGLALRATTGFNREVSNLSVSIDGENWPFRTDKCTPKRLGRYVGNE